MKVISPGPSLSQQHTVSECETLKCHRASECLPCTSGLLALPRDSLCKACDPQTLRGRCKVSLKGTKSRLFTTIIVCLRFFGSKCRALPLPRSLNRALPFHLAPQWVQKWIFTNSGFLKVWILFKHLCFLQRKWDLAPFPTPPPLLLGT